MGLLKTTVIVSIVVAVGVGIFWKKLNQDPPVPKLPDTWWGAAKAVKVDESIRPFKIRVSDEILNELQDRLELASNFTPPLETIQFQYGFNTNYLKKVVTFWANEYKWRERESFLNKFPQFKTRVSGLDLHYIHVKPAVKSKAVRVLPLLLLHGWPGSVREFYNLIPLLTTEQKGRDFVFEVVCPSLPGYGFSEGAHKPGMGSAEVAVIMKALMQRVGFSKFYVQGGDWGAIIAAHLGGLFPENILGLHSNMCSTNAPIVQLKMIVGSIWPSLFMDSNEASRLYPLGTTLARLMEEMGYMHIQASKPDTIGVALRESPVGLAAYILEKFSTWTNDTWKSLPDGGLTRKYTLTDLLDNVMIYWVTGSITTSMRLYSESLNSRYFSEKIADIPIYAPSACANFPNELLSLPRSFVAHTYRNLVSFSTMPRGGHFAAFEEPELLASDVWQAVAIMEKKGTEGKKS